MKIFNWVQRRFHNGALKDGLARSVKTAESITNEADKQALLKQVALVDVLDGWKDGILTIGTFGLDPLKPFNQQHDYSILESEDDEDGDSEEELEQVHYTDDDEGDDDDDDDVDHNIVENEEVNPLLFTTFDQNFRDLEANVVKSDDISTSDGVALVTASVISSCVAVNDQRKRITLAELFLADSDTKRKLDFDEIEVDSGTKKPVLRAKSAGMSFAKKLLPNVGEDSRPMKKIQQLMRRMLKRKIHPELEGKGFKAENQYKVATAQVLKEKAAESASLLQATTGPAI